MTIHSRGMRLFWVAGIVLLLGSIVGASVMFNQPASGTATNNGKGEPALLGVVGLGKVDVEGGIGFLHPVQAGRVTAVLVQEGDAVKEGDLLISLDNRIQKAKLQEAEEALQEAKLALANAEEQLPKKWQFEIDEQQTRLSAARINQKIAEYEYKIAEADAKDRLGQTAKDQLEIVKGKVDMAKDAVKGHEIALKKMEEMKPQGTIDRGRAEVKRKEAMREQAQLAVSECDVKAPCDGTVLRLFASKGDLLTAMSKQPAVHFCPDKPRVIRVEILQEWASKIQKGQIAFIEDDTRSGVQWKGKVERVGDWFGPRRDPLPEPFQYNNIRTMECIVYLDPGSPPVRIGQWVRVTIKQGGP